MATPAYEPSYLHRRKRLLFIPPIVGLRHGILGFVFLLSALYVAIDFAAKAPEQAPFCFTALDGHDRAVRGHAAGGDIHGSDETRASEP